MVTVLFPFRKLHFSFAQIPSWVYLLICVCLYHSHIYVGVRAPLGHNTMTNFCSNCHLVGIWQSSDIAFEFVNFVFMAQSLGFVLQKYPKQFIYFVYLYSWNKHIDIKYSYTIMQSLNTIFSKTFLNKFCIWKEGIPENHSQ